MAKNKYNHIYIKKEKLWGYEKLKKCDQTYL